MKIEYDGKIGPAFLTGLVQIIVLLVGGAVVWTQLTDRVEETGKKIEYSQKAITELRSDLSLDKITNASQSERLGRVEEALAFIKQTMARFESRFDNNGKPAKP